MIHRKLLERDRWVRFLISISRIKTERNKRIQIRITTTTVLRLAMGFPDGDLISNMVRKGEIYG